MSRRVVYSIVLLVIVSWSVALYFVSPEAIVSSLGATTLPAVFVAGVLGGTSIIFPFPYYLVVVTASAGGANPLLVGLSAGLGVIVGDTTSYLVGRAGREVLPAKAAGAIAFVQRRVSDIHTVKFYAFLFVYGAVMPLPNDIVMVPLGAAGVPYWRVILPFGAGNILFNIVVAWLSARGVSLW
jgi:membrane protein YqaA with SNARE-associated domain